MTNRSLHFHIFLFGVKCLLASFKVFYILKLKPFLADTWLRITRPEAEVIITITKRKDIKEEDFKPKLVRVK